MKRFSWSSRSLVVVVVVTVVTVVTAWLLGMNPALAGPAIRPAGMLGDVKGRASVRLGGSSDWRPAAILTLLPPGSVVRLEAGSEVVVEMLAGGTRITLTGPCEARIDAGSGSVQKGGAGQMRLQRPRETVAAPLPGGINLDRMGGRRRATLALLSDPVQMETRPELEWASSERFHEVEVRVETSNTGRRIMKATVPGTQTRVALPAGVELQRGTGYDVFLTGFRSDGSHFPMDGEPFRVRVLDATEYRSVTQAIESARVSRAQDPDRVAPVVWLLAVYLEHEMYGAAQAVARTLVEARPHDAGLRDLLERLQRRNAAPR